MKTLKNISSSILASSFLLSSFSFAVIIPSNGKQTDMDPLYNFQYYLQFTGQEVYRDITDITTSKVVTNPSKNIDIGIPINSSLDQRMNRDVLIAVLDSGVDLRHPDLINALYHNSTECVSNDIPFGATEDKDKNGLVGDCIGWNFTSANINSANPKGTNRPEDDLGHGTHVAGLIAATRGNNVGISGVSNRIKILPLKVTSTLDAENAKAVRQGRPYVGLPLSERVTRAIQYAIQMKVDVINMSFGWPSSADTVELRTAMQSALDAGITIVTAAGNNDTSSHIFPCAYEGVICVGSTGIDNIMSDFSNFGGHVDINAPGEEIISLFPTSMSPIFFSGKQYEIKSGTSQAAPLVSASVGILKGIYNNISEDEIKARLFLSAQDLDASPEDKFTQFGTLKVPGAIEIKPQVLSAPVFKNIDLVLFTNTTNDINFNLPIKNYWLAESNIKVQVESLSPQLQLSKTQFNLNLSQGQKVSLPIQAKLLNKMASGEVKIKVSISSPKQKSRSYLHNFQLARSIEKDPKLAKMPIKTSFPNGKPNLGYIQDLYDQSANPEYFWQEVTQSPNTSPQIKIHVLKLINGQYEEQPAMILNGVNRLITVLKIPLINKQVGYWVGAIDPVPLENKKRRIKYFYFNEDTRAAAIPEVNFVLETAVIDNSSYKNLNFVPAKLATQNNITMNIPVFISYGIAPKVDLNPDLTQFEQNNPIPRIYFLSPELINGEWNFATRVFDNYIMKERMTSRLHLKYKDDLQIVGFLPQVPRQNTVRILYSIGQSDLKRFIVISATAEQLLAKDFNIEIADYKSTQMDKGEMTSVIDVSGTSAVQGFSSAFTSFVTPVKALLQLITPTGTTQSGKYLIEPSLPQDNLLGFIRAYQDQDSFYSFTESKTKMIFQINGKDGSTKRFENPINRSSLVPGSYFSEFFTPVGLTSGGKVKPAVYVDSSMIYSHNVYLRVGDKNGLIAPAMFNIDIPNGCEMISPRKMGTKGVYQFMMLCKTPTGLEFRALPMEESGF